MDLSVENPQTKPTTALAYVHGFNSITFVIAIIACYHWMLCWIQSLKAKQLKKKQKHETTIVSITAVDEHDNWMFYHV